MKKIVCAILVFPGLVLLMGAQEIATTPTVKEVGGFWYAYMEFTATFPELQGKNSYCVEECRKQGVKTERAFTIFYNWSTKEGAQIKYEVGYILDKDTPVKPPLKIRKFEKIKAVVLTHTGSFEVPEITKTWARLDRYMNEQKLPALWPNYEIHYKNPLRMDLIYRLEE